MGGESVAATGKTSGGELAPVALGQADTAVELRRIGHNNERKAIE